MDIQPIKTEADHNIALQEIEKLWNAPYGSPEGNKLDVLVTLVEAYEDKHYPIETIPNNHTTATPVKSYCGKDVEEFTSLNEAFDSWES